MTSLSTDQWRETSLKDEVDLLAGFPFQSSQFTNDPTHPRLLRGDNVAQGALRWDGAKRWPTLESNGISAYELKRNDVIIAMDRPWIEAGLKYAWVGDNDLPSLLVQRVSRLRAKGRMDQTFLRYVIGSRYFTEHVLAVQTGTSIPHISASQILQYRFQCPPISGQRAIARVLGALDDKIELNRRLNRSLEELARAVFRSWFVDFDPVTANASGRLPVGLDTTTAELFPSQFQDSELGQIPKGWGVERLSDLTTKIGSGYTPRGGSAVYVEHGVALIRSQNVYDHEFQWGGLARITDNVAEDMKGVTVERDDVLINITGDSILRTCVVDPSVLPARVNQHVAIIRAKPGVPSRYLHQFLVQGQTKDLLSGFSAGGTRQAITKGHLESVRLPVPDDRLLASFKRSTDALFDQIDLNRAECRSLVAARDALLPPLLSGELRIEDVEKFLEKSR